MNDEESTDPWNWPVDNRKVMNSGPTQGQESDSRLQGPGSLATVIRSYFLAGDTCFIRLTVNLGRGCRGRTTQQVRDIHCN